MTVRHVISNDVYYRSNDIHFRHMLTVLRGCSCFRTCPNPIIPCPSGMYSLGGAYLNCTECPAGYACPNAASSPMLCSGGKTSKSDFEIESLKIDPRTTLLDVTLVLFF